MSIYIDQLCTMTMKLENDWGGGGTGFAVARDVDRTHVRCFVVTNKHVLGDTPELRNAADRIMLHLNLREDNGTIVGKAEYFLLHAQDGAPRWREHPDSDVDVAVLDITVLMNQLPQTHSRWLTYRNFPDPVKLQDNDISVGSDILILG